MSGEVADEQAAPGESEKDLPGPTSLHEIMKAARKEKARREQEMEDAMASLVISPEKDDKDNESGYHERQPKLKYDTATPLECGKSVGLVFDCRMLKHKTLQKCHHPEKPERILKPLERLSATNMLEELYLIEGREASKEEISVAHWTDHISDIAATANMDPDGELQAKQETFNSIYLCPDSYTSALVSCGSTLSIVERVVQGALRSGFALVRPPGHHAEAHTACGFCFFNNVAVAAKHAQSIAMGLGFVPSRENYRILILDWDVHHGNGTQNILYSDSSILYISLHRYDNGLFFPTSTDANYDHIGADAGVGFNINIPWNGARMGNAEYHAAFEHIVMPIAEEFNPDLVLVSSGFDAGKGDPLGGYHVTPNLYGYMTHRLQSLAEAKVVIVLEGGYNLNTVSECVLACIRSLLDFSKRKSINDTDEEVKMKHATPPKLKPPNSAGLSCIFETLEYITPYWPCLQKHKDEIEQMVQKEKRAAIEKLTKGFETLELGDLILDADSSGKRHSYGTRAKSRSAQKNKDRYDLDGKKYPGSQNEAKDEQDIESQAAHNLVEPASGDKKIGGDDSGRDISATETVEVNSNGASARTQPQDTINGNESQEPVSEKSSNASRSQPLDPHENRIGDNGSVSHSIAKTMLDNTLPEFVVSTPIANSSTPSEESPYFSANSTMSDQPDGGPSIKESEKFASVMDGSYLDGLTDSKSSEKRVATDKDVDHEELGACSAIQPAPNAGQQKEEIEMVLSAMGFTGTEEMTLEDMIAIAQAGLPEYSSGYVVPKDNCPHATEFISGRSKECIHFSANCSICGGENENWMCLKCAKVFCGRFVNRHMLVHYDTTGHAVALSHSDLSVWCYECESYLNNYTIEAVNDVYRKAHILKHGADLPS